MRHHSPRGHCLNHMADIRDRHAEARATEDRHLQATAKVLAIASMLFIALVVWFAPWP